MMVFEYAPNGTLLEHLHVREDGHLDWPTRLRVAVGIGYCLEHIHQLSPTEILWTLNTSTIYLTDDFTAKVAGIFFCSDEASSATKEVASLQFLAGSVRQGEHRIPLRYGVAGDHVR